jgi:hypothetical protein
MELLKHGLYSNSRTGSLLTATGHFAFVMRTIQTNMTNTYTEGQEHVPCRSDNRAETLPTFAASMAVVQAPIRPSSPLRPSYVHDIEIGNGLPQEHLREHHDRHIPRCVSNRTVSHLASCIRRILWGKILVYTYRHHQSAGPAFTSGTT